MEREAICPYCKEELKKMPGRKSRCPHCKKEIYVRTRPTRERVLIREDEIKNIESDWLNVTLVKEGIEALRGYGITEEDFAKRKEEFSKKSKKISDRDVVWSLFNELVFNKLKDNDLASLQMVYFQMALFVHKEGRDSYYLRQTAAKTELTKLRDQSSIVSKVRVLTAQDEKTCDACSRLEGKIFALEEALRDMPLPVKECTHKLNQNDKHGWCRCCYLYVR